MGLLPSAEGKRLLKQTHADKDSVSVPKFPLLFCRLCAVKTETTAAPAVTAVSRTAPPAQGALMLFPGSPNWAPWPSRTPSTTSNVTTRAAALQERPAANCRQESGAAARWSRCVHHWLHFISCTISEVFYALTTSVTHVTFISDNINITKTWLQQSVVDVKQNIHLIWFLSLNLNIGVESIFRMCAEGRLTSDSVNCWNASAVNELTIWKWVWRQYEQIGLKIPLPSPLQAVCCEDHEHCCPQGYTCNMQTGTCEKKDHDVLIHTLPQIKVVQSEPRDTEDDTDIPCDSTGAFHCPERDTCCKISATEWACCPSPRVRPHSHTSTSCFISSLYECLIRLCYLTWFLLRNVDHVTSERDVTWSKHLCLVEHSVWHRGHFHCFILFCYSFTRLQGNLGYYSD